MSRVVAQAILRLEPNAQFVIFGTKENTLLGGIAKI